MESLAIGGQPGSSINQLWGITATVLWYAITRFVVLKRIDLIIGLRIDEETERDRLDLRIHGEFIQ